ncbi:glutamate/tyrosine decarboxylase-like PLP-dependent enzyme [Aliiruegeria haliotis]|uniref:Glutamate/tyrosine decarboxylase-like PLP-dependent enzyme n=1 Tax=Aliiruegeria haliotis TaxID=1280846 RepID=A0A2T0RUZ5_9RHOB|nr:pyridoxal-dependent decarboxylase [Aliiruegeria haliotis]PRY24873.1 glutamate/tyrosine decarboxylase-like PLP-dependent enzyme [Aliiruegeria haliotis]
MAENDTRPDSLDPADWPRFRAEAHAMLDAAIDRMEQATEGPVWQAPPPELRAAMQTPLPRAGLGAEAVQTQLRDLLPYGVGNTHPRFFGWVHGSGTPSNLMADIAAAALNANLGGRDHGAIHVERQVIRWCRALFGFPASASGLIVSGTSIATIIALKAARDRTIGAEARTKGPQARPLTGYTSAQTHACVARAFDMLGLGSDALRRIPTNGAFEIDIDALRASIAADRAAGSIPFALIGTAGSVNTGAMDDLDQLAGIAATESLWFHVDGAFGALGILTETLRPRLAGLERADSLAFDFHKWMHVNYDAGFVLIRDEADHRAAFADRPDYLQGAERGLAGGNPWPVDYGPELSRGFRALKVWAQIAEHGTDRIGRLIERNCAQARQLAALVDAHPRMERLAPVALNICNFRFAPEGVPDLDDLNREIVTRLQLHGLAAPSTTTLNGQTAIRVNITNHRTRDSDLPFLVEAVERTGNDLLSAR